MHGPRSDLLFGFQSRFLCSTLPVLLMMWCMRVRSSRLCLSTVLQRSSSICAGESSAQPITRSRPSGRTSYLPLPQVLLEVYEVPRGTVVH